MNITLHYRMFARFDYFFKLPPFEQTPNYDKLLDWIFRQFNRVDGSELISLLGLKYPSLSVGDYITIGEHDHYRIDPVGFTIVTAEEIGL